MTTPMQNIITPVQEAEQAHAIGPIHLKPVLPSHNPRYSRPEQYGLDTRSSTILTGASLASPPNHALPEGWTEHISPEGQVYFHHPAWKLVTTVDVRLARNVDVLAHVFEQIITALVDHGGIPDAEVYLNLGQGHTLDYYLVDHVDHQLFWLSEVSTSDLGFAPYESPGFLKSAMTAEYWAHIDYFPCHSQFNEQAEQELMNVLRFYCVDDMTSPVSTSPYSAKECRQYLKMLQGFRSSGDVSGSRTATSARLWASIARVRHINAYGLRFPRLDRLHGPGETAHSQSRSSSRLSFGETLSFNQSSHMPWNGRAAYHRHLSSLFESMRKEWFMMGALALVLLLADAIMITFEKPAAAYVVSAVLSGLSVLSAVFLHQIHREFRLASASDISAYIMKVENLHHGLRPLALGFSHPCVLAVSSAIFLGMGLIKQSLENVVTVSDFLLTAAAWCFPFAPVVFLRKIF